jgi:predicted ATPase/DNA-binding SARP family transcriptional activator
VRAGEASHQMQGAMHVRMLGGFAVLIAGRAVPDHAWRLRRARSLVTLLALAPGHRLHREQLMDTLWPDLSPAAAANNLHKVTFMARRAIALALDDDDPAGWLRSCADALQLDPPGGLSTDAAAFERAAAALRDSTDAVALRGALDLYTGDLLPDDLYEDWAITRRETLRRSWLDLLYQLAQVEERREEFSAAIALLERLVAAAPLHEDGQARLIRLYALAGHRERALRQYDALRDALRAELDTVPDASTAALAERIRAASTCPNAPASWSTRHAPPGKATRRNLPVTLSDVIGRERELDDVRRLVDAARLVTLTGVGGGGKTRLAVEVLAALPNRDVSFVELAPVADGARVAGAVAAALGLPDAPGRPAVDAVAGALGDDPLLLVLDNCEHVIDAAAELVATLLRRCSGLRVLATSREPLRVPGEILYPVPPLAVPAAGTAPDPAALGDVAAVRLFVERARSTMPGFALDDDTAAPVAEICRRLEGIPLAIELAAARAHACPPVEIAARLDEALRFLTTGSRTAPGRHRSLQAALDWSWSLLAADEQRLLSHLSVFAGSWTLDSATALFAAAPGDTLALLAGLVDRSLVVPLPARGPARWRLLEPVRQYATARLAASGGDAAARRRHRDLYVRYVVAHIGPWIQRGAILSWVDEELDNLRAALRSCDSGDDGVEPGLWMSHALFHFTEERGWLAYGLSREARDALERFLGRADGVDIDRDILSAVLLDQAMVSGRAADFERVVALADRNLALAPDDPLRRALWCHSVGIACRERGDFERARALLQEGMRHARPTGDHRWLGLNQIALGDTLYRVGAWEAAAAVLHDAQAVVRPTRYLPFIGQPPVELAVGALRRGDLERAERDANEALAAFRAGRWNWGIARAQSALARVAHARGALDDAAARWDECFDRYRAAGERRHLPDCLEHRAALELDLGHPERAARLFQEASAIRIAHQLVPAPAGRAAREELAVRLSATANGHGHPDSTLATAVAASVVQP